MIPRKGKPLADPASEAGAGPPSQASESTPHLSVVIPAFNEENRLPPTLLSLLSYFPSINRSYEIIVVDDGSHDQTKAIVDRMQAEHPELRILSHQPNHGRGVSVRKGVLAARGAFILETDADGSVSNEAIGRFLGALEADPDLHCVFGSREMAGARVARHQPPIRVILGKGFILLARVLFLMWDVTDFTLGFKMFRREAALDIFAKQFDPHYLAEAELVFVAGRRGWKRRELPVIWTDNRDSRVRPFKESFRSLKGMAAILIRWLRGRYA